MGTVGLALVAAAPANADDSKPVTKPKTGTATETLVRDDWYQSGRLGQRPLVVRSSPAL